MSRKMSNNDWETVWKKFNNIDSILHATRKNVVMEAEAIFKIEERMKQIEGLSLEHQNRINELEDKLELMGAVVIRKTCLTQEELNQIIKDEEENTPKTHTK